MKVNILVSFAEGVRTVERYLDFPGFRVLLDSGAFTNYMRGQDVVTLDAYRGYLRERGDAFWRYFTLDKIADVEASRRNLDVLLDDGLRPIPVFQRGPGGDVAELRRLMGISDIVAIGGVGGGRLSGAKHVDYLRQVMSASAGHRMHILGCGVERLMRQYRPYSCDSSAHALRRGKAFIWYQHRIWVLRRAFSCVLLNDKPIAKHGLAIFARMLSAYDIDASCLSEQKFYGSTECSILNLRSYMRYSEYLRCRYGVQYFPAVGTRQCDAAEAAWHLEEEYHARMHTAA